ncbi:MAG: hypothetical protein K2J32_13500 [Ruminococcus sp.]|nr:hypothetical protein [Ruminococcus sp.]
MKNKKFFGIPEIILLSSMIIPVITAFFGKNVNSDMIKIFTYSGKTPDKIEGHAGAGSIIDLFYWVIPPVYLLNFSALLVKKYKFVLCLISGITMLLPAVVMLYGALNNEGIDYLFFFTLPELLIISAFVVSGTEKRNQINE